MSGTYGAWASCDWCAAIFERARLSNPHEGSAQRYCPGCYYCYHHGAPSAALDETVVTGTPHDHE